MSTWFNSQVGEGKYAIQMETSSKELYDVVQEKIRNRMDDERRGRQPNVRPRDVKRGKWIDECGDISSDGRYRCCSRCGGKVFVLRSWLRSNKDADYDFCPHCGADMREVQE